MTGLAAGYRPERSRNKRQQILKRVARSNQNYDSKPRLRKILLELKILIGGEKDLETRIGCSAQEFSVLEARPTLLLDRTYVVPGKLSRQLTRKLLIEQHAHRHSRPHVRLQAPRSPARVPLMGTH